MQETSTVKVGYSTDWRNDRPRTEQWVFCGPNQQTWSEEYPQVCFAL